MGLGVSVLHPLRLRQRCPACAAAHEPVCPALANDELVDYMFGEVGSSSEDIEQVPGDQQVAAGEVRQWAEERLRAWRLRHPGQRVPEADFFADPQPGAYSHWR